MLAEGHNENWTERNASEKRGQISRLWPKNYVIVGASLGLSFAQTLLAA
jgi:hypothetical protein